MTFIKRLRVLFQIYTNPYRDLLFEVKFDSSVSIFRMALLSLSAQCPRAYSVYGFLPSWHRNKP